MTHDKQSGAELKAELAALSVRTEIVNVDTGKTGEQSVVVPLELRDRIIEALNTRSLPQAGEGVEADIEDVAWAWLDSKFLNIEAGDDPSDRDYSADDMVDAFIAGFEKAIAALPPAGRVEELEGLLNLICAAEDDVTPSMIRKLFDLPDYSSASRTALTGKGHP